MLKAYTAVIFTAAIVGGVVASSIDAAASSTKQLKISEATVSVAPKGGQSAVTLKIVNDSGQPVSIESVKSPFSRMNMIYFDTNMCQGNNTMTWLSNIILSNGFTQRLGYKNQGAMLGQLDRPLLRGQRIPLVISWSDFSKFQTMTVMAKVVVPPKKLNFKMSPMRM